MLLKNRVALITGAGSGIGKAAALLLACEGAKIAALGCKQEQISQTVSEIKQAGGLSIGLVADVSDPSQMQDAIKQVAEEWDCLDVVFANAGINGVWASLEELTAEEWDRTLAVNLKGTFLTVKYSVPLLKRRGGSVIVTSSVNGTRIFSNTGATAYACSKAAQVAFAKMSALELAKHRVRVNVICPGTFGTNIKQDLEARGLEKIREPVEFPQGQIPLTRGVAGTPEQVADLVLFLASDASSHITGTEIWIDGAESLLQG